MTHFKILPALLCTSLLAACASTAPARAPGAGMSNDEARQIVDRLEALYAEGSPTEKLRQPESLEDVLDILRRDQIDLFGSGVKLAKGMQDTKAKALHAQIELSWGEAQALLAGIIRDHAQRLREGVQRLEFKKGTGPLSKDEADELDYNSKRLVDAMRQAQALDKVAAEHVSRGAKLALAVIEANPDSYLGYRVAADYYRLREDWGKFDAAMAKIEEKNPQSVGLLFLKGVAAAYRVADFEGAKQHFAAALEKDPEFLRCRVHMLRLHQDVASRYEEYTTLRKQNARHQVVLWAGPTIEATHRAWQKRQRQLGAQRGASN